MSVQVFKYPIDVPVSDAMLVWSSGEKVGVVPHPDDRGLADDFRSSVGACFTSWREQTTEGQKAMLMVEAWHVAAFYDIPAKAVHEAMLCIPEYRDMLADDCLPKQYRSERGI